MAEEVKKSSQHNYSDSNIEVLEGLEAVRRRPGMYIGSLDYHGLHHCIWEIVDNAIDEAMAGHGKNITITLHKDNSVTIQDDGRGVPTGMHKTGVPTTQVVYTHLHAGGKFNDSSYKVSSGLHGVGASVVTALSEYLDVVSCNNGIMVHQRFEKGGKIIHPQENLGKTNKSGTTVTFRPDPKVFDSISFDRKIIENRLRENAFLLKKIQFTFIDEKNNKKDSYYYENGVVSFVEYLNEDKSKINEEPIYFHGTEGKFELDVSFQFCKAVYDERVFSFVNTVRTIDGGTHEVGFKAGMTRAFNDYAHKYNLVKDKDKVNGDDYREGMIAVLSCRMQDPQFVSQTKSKLGNSEVKSIVEGIIYEQMTYFLEEHKPLAVELINKALKSASVREAARKAKEAARSGKKIKEQIILSGKLTPAQSKNYNMNELFLVEGDSAGGSAKQGRERLYQAILPLRGKVLNVEKADMADVLKNEEIATMINTIGAGYGKEFKLKDAKYNKIIIMTDADVDGSHIQILLLTFFYRYMRPLFEEGRIYIAMPPLYKVYKMTNKGEKFEYAWDDLGLEEAKKKIGPGYKIQRYKGLGEMNAEQLWETTMNPKTRTLIQVSIDNELDAERQVSILMGSDSGARKDWINENVKFTLEDDFYGENKGGE